MVASKIVRINDSLTIDLEELRQFLLYAKPLGYAAENPKILSPARIFFKELAPIRRRKWAYQDSYAGSVQAPGQEWVTYDGIPVWMMGYAGGMIEGFRDIKETTQMVYSFLKEALRQPNPDLPLRGPLSLQSGSYGFPCIYHFCTEGSLEFFRGEERITTHGCLRPFHQYVCGGLVIH